MRAALYEHCSYQMQWGGAKGRPTAASTLLIGDTDLVGLILCSVVATIRKAYCSLFIQGGHINSVPS